MVPMLSSVQIPQVQPSSLPGVAPCQQVFFQRTGAHTVRLYRVTHTKGSDLCKCNLWYRWATFSNGYTCRSNLVVVREGRDKIINLEHLGCCSETGLDREDKRCALMWTIFSESSGFLHNSKGRQTWTQATHTGYRRRSEHNGQPYICSMEQIVLLVKDFLQHLWQMKGKNQKVKKTS